MFIYAADTLVEATTQFTEEEKKFNNIIQFTTGKLLTSIIAFLVLIILFAVMSSIDLVEGSILYVMCVIGLAFFFGLAMAMSPIMKNIFSTETGQYPFSHKFYHDLQKLQQIFTNILTLLTQMLNKTNILITTNTITNELNSETSTITNSLQELQNIVQQTIPTRALSEITQVTPAKILSFEELKQVNSKTNTALESTGAITFLQAQEIAKLADNFIVLLKPLDATIQTLPHLIQKLDNLYKFFQVTALKKQANIVIDSNNNALKILKKYFVYSDQVLADNKIAINNIWTTLKTILEPLHLMNALNQELTTLYQKPATQDTEEQNRQSKVLLNYLLSTIETTANVIKTNTYGPGIINNLQTYTNLLFLNLQSATNTAQYLSSQITNINTTITTNNSTISGLQNSVFTNDNKTLISHLNKITNNNFVYNNINDFPIIFYMASKNLIANFTNIKTITGATNSAGILSVLNTWVTNKNNYNTFLINNANLKLNLRTNNLNIAITNQQILDNTVAINTNNTNITNADQAIVTSYNTLNVNAWPTVLKNFNNTTKQTATDFTAINNFITTTNNNITTLLTNFQKTDPTGVLSDVNTLFNTLNNITTTLRASIMPGTNLDSTAYNTVLANNIFISSVSTWDVSDLTPVIKQMPGLICELIKGMVQKKSDIPSLNINNLSTTVGTFTIFEKYKLQLTSANNKIHDWALGAAGLYVSMLQQLEPNITGDLLDVFNKLITTYYYPITLKVGGSTMIEPLLGANGGIAGS